MQSKGVAIAVLALVAFTNAQDVTCDSSQGLDIPRKDDLTFARALVLCPDFLLNPNVKIKYAVRDDDTGEGGHCGNNPEKTEWLQKSIANGLFGGNDNEGQFSFTGTILNGRDCSAYCIKNSEGRGHFKFNDKKKCFQFRNVGMCGTQEEQDFANDRKARLCTPPPLPPICRKRCVFGKGSCKKKVIFGLTKCKSKYGGSCQSGYTDCSF